MKYYTVAEMDITDPSWIREYVTNVTGMVERRGGAIWLARGRSTRSRATGRRPNCA